jgi:RNA polymerase sigma-70 factor (ECF subfamily)
LPSLPNGAEYPQGQEQDLIASARHGDVAAFGQLVELHRAACLRVATLRLRNRGDAEDEVQNALWKAFRHLEQFRADGPFGAWLIRIVENQCLMRMRKDRSAHLVRLDETSDWKPGVELMDQLSSPEDELGCREVIELLRREVLRIPPLLRYAMILRDLEQLGINDVATRLGVSVPAAKSRLMRAREELRSRIRKHCGRKGPGTLTQRQRYAQMAFKRAG